MNSFNVVGNTSPCLGIGPNDPTDLPAVMNPLAPPSGNPDYYPMVSGGGGRFPTRCDPPVTDCSTVAMCAGGSEQNCEVTVLDNYTSSFHWTEENFAAIWLRPQWYLLINSVLSDVQNGGLTFVTGGDYTHAETIPGHWALARRNVFIGETQASNPFASNSGPFNAASGLACDTAQGNNCLSRAEGVAFPLSDFGNNQRLFNIYDGPSYQDSNAYLNITETTIPDCTPNPNGNCFNSQSMYGRVLGMPRDGNRCYLPNAAIAWKQPNGFYYPPAFHSRNLFFQNVDIRHFVIEPLFQGTDPAFDPTQSVSLVRANIQSAPLGFTPAAWPAGWTRDYDPKTGILTVAMDLGAFASDFAAAQADSCQPASFCTWNGSQCVCALDASDPLYADCIADDSAICSYPREGLDCPQGGCLGFSVTLPASFATDPMVNPRPAPVPFPQTPDWNVPWTLASQDLAGSCYQPPTSAIIGTNRSEKLVGTKGDDIILGKGGRDRIFGRGGNDIIFAGPGNDVVHGGRGRDTIDGGTGRDRLIGGRGKDVCVNGERRSSCK
jgi:hypothetical protein